MINADPPSVKYSQMFIWSREEIHVFLNACKSEPHYLTFLIAIYTGMRRGEILGLKWEDIDFTNKIIRVNRSLAYDPKGAYLFTPFKIKSSKRQLPISEVLVNELRRHKDNQKKWKELVGELYQDRDLVICTITGTEQNPQNLVRVMKRVIKNRSEKN